MKASATVMCANLDAMNDDDHIDEDDDDLLSKVFLYSKQQQNFALTKHMDVGDVQMGIRSLYATAQHLPLDSKNFVLTIRKPHPHIRQEHSHSHLEATIRSQIKAMNMFASPS